MKGFWKKALAATLALSLVTVPVEIRQTTEVKAEQLGSLATEVTGTWSYWDGEKDVVQTNKMLLDKLPTRANQGTYRFTTENYDANNGAIDIGGFSTSMLWNYSTSSFGDCVYAIPMAYCGTANGMLLSKPSTLIDKQAWTQTVMMSMNNLGTMSDFIVGTGYSFTNTKVDKSDEWLTDVVMENLSDSSQYMKTTMVQGSPFAYFQAKGDKKLTIQRPRNLPSEIVSYNGTSITDSTMLIIRVFDNADQITGYGDYDYYAIYLPEGATVTQADATAKYADNKMGDLTVTFVSEDKAYMSIAWLCETNGQKDAEAKQIAEAYQPYAYNFITDTKTSFTYDAGIVTTTYKYTIDKKAESTADGTVMGIMPHQYKHMSGYTYLSNTARTIRGTMKYLVGDTYQTTLKFGGILPSLPGIDDMDKSTLQGYVDEFMEKYGPTDDGGLTKEKYDVNTYDTGKKLNRAVQAMEAAEECGDTQAATKILQGIENELADWFTADGTENDKYFYYDEGTGSLFGFPQAYYTVDGMTDHHFHYGYFINASAQVAMRDPEFIKQYSNVIDELIGDVATYEENHKDSRYPFLRNFSTFEGHSWASGHANFGDGNNQESSSEAINAWAGLILYGQAMGDEDLTALGVYLYETEVSSVNCYWFDIDGDVLDSKYTEGTGANAKYIQASMVWGGKYTYSTWWTDEPLQVQGINILPMTAASFYAARNKEYIINNWKTAVRNENSYGGLSEKKTKRWNEIWSEYLAMADPAQAMEYFDDKCDPEAGESKAHAYHWIMAMDKAGTPELDITSDNPLACVFKNADDEMTYVAYNASDVEKNVTFSDGAELVVPPHSMASVGDGQIASKTTYKIEHYLSDGNGGYTLVNTDTKSAKIGAEVTAASKSYPGYEVNMSAEGTVSNGIVAEDGSLVLKLYYDISEIKTTTPYEDDKQYTSLGDSNGYPISYTVLRDDFGIGVKLLDANDTFYMEYSGEYSATNTTAYLNKNESSALTGVFKLSVKSSLKPDSYNTVKLVSGGKQVYILIKYGNPTEAPDLSDFESDVPVTTPDPDKPTEAMGLILGTPSNNVVSVTFRTTAEQDEKGQIYNIYVDNVVKLSGVSAGTYMIEDIGAGNHKVTVKAVLNGYESEGISDTVKVAGEVITDEPGTTPAVTTPDTSKDETTPIVTTPDTSKDETTPIVTTPDSQDGTTPIVTTPDSSQKITTSVKTTTKKVTVGKAKIKKAKKTSKKKIKLTFKKLKGIKGYQIKISKKKKFKKKYTITRVVKKNRKVYKIKVSAKKLKNAKKLYVKARAYKVVNGKKVYGKWSKQKVVKR